MKEFLSKSCKNCKYLLKGYLKVSSIGNKSETNIYVYCKHYHVCKYIEKESK